MPRNLLFTCLLVPAIVLSLWQDSDAQFRFRRGQAEVDEDPESPVNRARLEADQAYQRGDYRGVVDLATQWLQPFPDDHLLLHLRASARIELGKAARSSAQIREGIADARQSLAVAGKKYVWLYIPYFYGLTALAEVEGKVEHAQMALKVADPLLARPDISPDDRPNLHYQRALARAASKDLEGAAEDYQETLRSQPDHLAANLNLARLYVQTKDFERARATYDRAIEVLPRNVLIINDRGTFLRTAGDLDGAIADFTLAIDTDPNFTMGYINRGICLLEQHEPRAAEADLSQALQQNPQLAFVHEFRGTARVSSGNATEAIADYSAAVQMEPKNAARYQLRGFARFFLGEFKAAAVDFAAARKLQPGLTELVPWQYLALWRDGQTEAAQQIAEAFFAAQKTPTGWTALLCSYLLEQKTDEELLVGARESESSVRNFRVCEAHYFIGQKKLLGQEKEGAAEHFRESLKTNAKTLSAYRGARYELQDFGAK